MSGRFYTPLAGYWFKRMTVVAILLFLSGLILFPKKAYADTYTVTKTADTNDGTCDADCSLREAVTAANNHAGADTIEFNIPTSDGGYVPASGSTQAYWTITLTSRLTLSDDDGMFINGFTQPGSERNTAKFGNSINTILNIDLFFNFNGTAINITGNNNHIAGLNIRTIYTGASMGIDGSNNNWIEGNFFGTEITGMQSSGGGEFWLTNGSSSNIFGTNGDNNLDIGERNLFGGDQQHYGFITFTSTSGGSNIVAGNYFGTSVTGRNCISPHVKRSDVSVASDANQIGTNYDNVSDQEEANLMGCGVKDSYYPYLRMLVGANNNYIQGNFIGISPNGDSLASTVGVSISGIDFNGVTIGNIVKGNKIAYTDIGIRCRNGCTNNTFRSNVIHSNQFLDIALDSYINSLPNDPGDTDTGPNDLMNYPVITSAEYLGENTFQVNGTLDGKASEAPYTIEVCRSSDSASGYGGCAASLGTMSLSSPGNWGMRVTVDGSSSTRLMSFTALATNANGSTSEFSRNVGGRLPDVVTTEAEADYSAATAPAVTITKIGDVTSLVAYGVFAYDAYLDVAETPKEGAFRIPGTSYWQDSPQYEVWWRSFFNDAKILPSEVDQPFTLAFNYDPVTMEPTLPITNLRLAYSADGISWTILKNSVLDLTNQTVALVTTKGGFYMLASGYPTTSAPTETHVKGVTTETEPTPNPNPETTPLSTPLPTPPPAQPTPTPNPTETPQHCFLTWCW